MKPPLRWVGSKRWHADFVRSVWCGERIVEPFAGSAAVTFALEPQEALLIDANPHLINFYRWAQAGRKFDMTELPDHYASNRAWFNLLVRSGQENSFEAALVFYYLNQRAFNNLWRVNRRGEFNVPPGRQRPLENFDGSLPRWATVCADFLSATNLLHATDLVYADPPYDGTFTGYTAEGWSQSDLLDLLLLLSEHPGRVIITNAVTPFVLTNAPRYGYHVTTIAGGQRMHTSRGRSGAVAEALITNFPVDPSSTTDTMMGATV